LDSLTIEHEDDERSEVCKLDNTADVYKGHC
jgi:hypothetical protein